VAETAATVQGSSELSGAAPACAEGAWVTRRMTAATIPVARRRVAAPFRASSIGHCRYLSAQPINSGGDGLVPPGGLHDSYLRLGPAGTKSTAPRAQDDVGDMRVVWRGADARFNHV